MRCDIHLLKLFDKMQTEYEWLCGVQNKQDNRIEELFSRLKTRVECCRSSIAV